MFFLIINELAKCAETVSYNWLIPVIMRTRNVKNFGPVSLLIVLVHSRKLFWLSLNR